MARKIDEESMKWLPKECIVEIKSLNFKAAENMLKIILDDSKINFIVKEVYGGNPGNFDLVLNFGDSINHSIQK